MLRRLCDDVTLLQLIGEWDSYRLQLADGSREKITCRPVDRLIEQVFIARIGTLPEFRPRRMLTFKWVVTDAGRAWLAANPDGWRKTPKARKSA